jgi:hypothetical protein
MNLIPEKNTKKFEKRDEYEMAIYAFEIALQELIIKKFKNLKNDVDEISEKLKSFVGTLHGLLTYNANLLAVAALFDYIYKNKVTEKSVTEFIKSIGKYADPIDTIRYIRIYQAQKIENS